MSGRLLVVALVVLGYLAGSVPWGVLLARRLRGVDVRAAGSGNIGATNVARVAGRGVGAAVLLLDALKGALPVALARALVPQDAGLHAAVGMAAVLGHVFPVWLRLRGGKGVATALGVLGVLLPLSALAAAAVWLTLVLVLRLSSLGSLLGGATAVAVAVVTRPPPEYAWFTVAMLALLLGTHRGNIVRLWRHTERRF